ncbi:MAG: NBR1-Ig-like domain-containing protein [Betaproteobacteria bacterium]
MLGVASLLPAVARAQQLVYSAAFVSETVPAVVAVGADANVSITMRNTGSRTWVQAEGDVFLATQEPQDNYYWCIQGNPYGSRSGNRVLLPRDVAPGAEVTFDFVVRPLGCRFAAPAPLRFRMLSQAFGTFGEETPDPMIGVASGADYVSQQVPATVPAGATVQVTVTFKNTSTATWNPSDGYALVSASPLGNTTWGTSSVTLPSAVAPGDSVTFSFFVVAPATPGTYTFQWQMSATGGAPFGKLSPATTVTVVTAGPPNYSGLWWNSPAGSESGWGINLAHESDTIFATWFTYDATGKGLWLSMTARASGTGTFAGALMQSSGPAFSAVPFAPAQVRNVTVGSAALTFTDKNNATFAYTLKGITQTKTITRQIFGAQLPTCTFNLVTDLSTAYNYQDLWWAAPAGSEAGWGLNVTQQGDVIFLTWFTYGTDGAPMWVFAGAPKTAPGVYSGKLYRTTGPAFNAMPFLSSNVVATEVGTASVTFTDGKTGTFAYTLDGVTQTKAITREILVAPGTVCQ